MASDTIVIDIVANFKNQTSSGMKSIEQSSDRASKAVEKTRREIDKLGSTTARPTVSITDRASSSLSKINSGLTKLGGKTFRVGVRIIDYATRPLRMIKNSLFSIKGLVMAIGAGWAANKLLMNPISLADQYSSAKIGFSTLLGDKQGQKMMDDLDKFAKETPFKTSNTISQAQKMIAMGWDAKNIVKDMTTIGDAAAATGKGDEGLNRIVLALAQIKSKGKLSTEELNQLAEAGISAKRYIAEGLGYGSGDKGLMQMSKDLEKGAIGSEAAIQAIMSGMKEYQGMMDKTANETVKGLKSQIEDTFEINIFRKWGQGLQDGAKRGLGSIVKLLNESEGSLEKFGDTVYEIGKQLSNWTADKLENTIDKILEVTNSKEFKDASIGGKIKIMWDEVIAKPFGKWWDSTGNPFIIKKMSSIGEGLGSGLSKGLLALLGIKDNGIIGEATTIGGSFASGFAKGFESKKVGKALVDSLGRAFKAGFKLLLSGSWLSKIIAAKISLSIASGVAGGISKLQHLWYGAGPTGGLFGTSGIGYAGGGLKGFLGGASTASGSLVGSGLIGKLASLGAISTGHGGLLGKTILGMTPQTGGGLALAGLGTSAGIIGGVAGLGNSLYNLTQAVTAQTNNDKKLYGTRSATKAGMVGLGAGIGTLLAPGVGTAIGAGLGGLATFLAGNKLADAISGVSKSTAELNEEAEKLANKRMNERFDGISLSAEQLSKKVKQVFGEKTISRVKAFNQALSELDTVKESANNYIDDLSFTHERIMDKEKLSASDIESYKNSLQDYADSVKQLLVTNKTSSNKAYTLLFGDDVKGAQKATKSMNSMYSKLEKELAKKSEKLNDVIAKAFEDGKITINEEKKINEIVSQIEDIQRKIDERIRAREEAKSEATYDMIEEKFKNNDYDLDSFKNVISELDAQRAIDNKAYDDARIEATADVKLQLKLGEINQKEADKKLAEIEAKWREGKTITLKRNVKFTFDIINDKYGNELSNIESKLNSGNIFTAGQLSTVKDSTFSRLKKGSNVEVIKWNDKAIQEFKDMKDKWLEESGIDLALQKEMSTLYESLKPQEQDLLELKKSYEDAGEAIPKWIEDSLEGINNIKLMSGDMDSFYEVIGEQLAKEDRSYAEALLEAEKKGEKIPEKLIDGINKGLGNVEVEVPTIECETNLKLTADEKNIDTSGLDKTTKDVIQKLKDNDIIKITKDGEVTIKTKDGKVDTTGLDEDTKKAVEKLENEGIIQIDKDGNVTIKATVNTSEAKTKTDTITKTVLGTTVSVDKKGNVTVDSDVFGTDTAASKAFNQLVSALATKFATSINEDGKVNINSVSLSGVSTAVSNAWSSFRDTVRSKFGGSIYTNPQIKYRIGVSPTSKGDADEGHNANGSYVDRAIRTIVGEAGPEYIIPVSPNRRQRGKYLWERAGRALGVYDNEDVYMNANGGLYGSGSSRIGELISNSGSNSGTNTETTHSGNRHITVDVGGISISIQSSGNGIQEDINQNADAISGQIASILEKAFQNMPTTVEA